MGDRALVVFKNVDHYTAAIYSHYSGHDMPDLLKQSAKQLRDKDASYSAARFCCFMGDICSGNTWLWIMKAPTPEDVVNGFEKYSHGDAGVLVVDVNTWQVKCYAGYLAKFNPDDDTADWREFAMARPPK